jgi:DNA-binding CsgD family transcriptional regulator
MGWNDVDDDSNDPDEDSTYEYFGESVQNNWDSVDGAIDSELDLDRLLEVLTPRETEVLHMLIDGYNDEEIAVRLDVTRQMINYFHKQIQIKATDLGITRI